MNALLDTNALIFLTLNQPRLSVVATRFITDEGNRLLVSPVAHWEIAIKLSVGQFELDQPLADFWQDMCARYLLEALPIGVSHSMTLASLPYHHRDPFDRMLVAQALVENLPIVSSDAQLDAYGIQRIW